jgi:hypothetical protein
VAPYPLKPPPELYRGEHGARRFPRDKNVPFSLGIAVPRDSAVAHGEVVAWDQAIPCDDASCDPI